MTKKLTTTADCETAEDYRNFSQEADKMAREFVNPLRKHGKSGKLEPVGWEFHERFRSHPWVRAAENEGWGKELRAALIATVRRRILNNMPYDGAIGDLLPPPEWISAQRLHAEQVRLATEWQKQNYMRWSGPNKDRWKEDDHA